MRPDNPIDPFDYITIASLCKGMFQAKFLPKKWKILTKSKAWEGCSHNNWECLCKWNKGCKSYRNAPLGMLHSDGTWAVPIDDLICQFISSPIALLPIHGYLRRDNYSQQAMQWILSGESKMQQVDKNFKIRHTKSFLGEKCVTYRDVFGRLQHYKLDGYFVDAEGNQHAMEFNGCWYHGCPRCYPNDRESLQVMGKTLQQ